MESKDILIIVLIITVAGISLYRRYLKRRSGQNIGQGTGPIGSTKLSQKDDDEYEPYSKRS